MLPSANILEYGARCNEIGKRNQRSSPLRCLQWNNEWAHFWLISTSWLYRLINPLYFSLLLNCGWHHFPVHEYYFPPWKNKMKQNISKPQFAEVKPYVLSGPIVQVGNRLLWFHCIKVQFLTRYVTISLWYHMYIPSCFLVTFHRIPTVIFDVALCSAGINHWLSIIKMRSQ